MKFKLLHQEALAVAAQMKRLDSQLIDLLQKIDACRGFTELGYASLHVYATKALGLSDEVAFKLIRIERKSVEVPELKQAVAEGKISVSKATVVASVITQENKAEWLELACTSTKQSLERAVANTRPELPKSERVRHQGNDLARLDLSITEETLELLRRAQELLAQKRGKPISLAEVLHALAKAFVKREDPVEKADRNAQKAVPEDSANLHKVHQRDRGQCQFKNQNGEKCGARQWLHIHHIKPKAKGGSNEAPNLITLCSAHHRILHRKANLLHSPLSQL